MQPSFPLASVLDFDRSELVQVAMDNGAKRALIPIKNKRQFLEVNPDVLEQVDPIFYSDLRQAVFKSLGLN